MQLIRPDDLVVVGLPTWLCNFFLSGSSLRWQWKVRKHDVNKSCFNLLRFGMLRVKSSIELQYWVEILYTSFPCFPVFATHSRNTPSTSKFLYTARLTWAPQLHLWMNLPGLLSWYPWFLIMISAWLMSLLMCLFELSLASTVSTCMFFAWTRCLFAEGLRSRSFGRYTREKPRSGSSRTPSSVFCDAVRRGSKLEGKVNDQQTTCQCVFLLQYHCMTLFFFLCIVLLSLVWWASLLVFKCPESHLLRRRSFNFSGRGFWWNGDTFETIQLFLKSW